MFGKHLLNEAQYIKYVQKDRAHRSLWRGVALSGSLQRTLRALLNLSMKRDLPLARENINRKQNQSQIVKKRKADEDAQRAREASSAQAGAPKAAHPRQPMHRRGLWRLQRHPAQGDLMLGKKSANHVVGIGITIWLRPWMVKVAGTLVVQRWGRRSMGFLAPVGYPAAVEFVGCGMISCLPRLLPRLGFPGLSFYKRTYIQLICT